MAYFTALYHLNILHYFLPVSCPYLHAYPPSSPAHRGCGHGAPAAPPTPPGGAVLRPPRQPATASADLRAAAPNLEATAAAGHATAATW